MTGAQFLGVGRFVINHYVVGTGAPLICLHGLGGSGNDWAEVVPILSHQMIARAEAWLSSKAARREV